MSESQKKLNFLSSFGEMALHQRHKEHMATFIEEFRHIKRISAEIITENPEQPIYLTPAMQNLIAVAAKYGLKWNLTGQSEAWNTLTLPLSEPVTEPESFATKIRNFAVNALRCGRTLASTQRELQSRFETAVPTTLINSWLRGSIDAESRNIA